MGDVVDFRPKVLVADKNTTLPEVISSMLELFKVDPPDTDYQLGFEACLRVLVDDYIKRGVK